MIFTSVKVNDLSEDDQLLCNIEQFAMKNIPKIPSNFVPPIMDGKVG